MLIISVGNHIQLLIQENGIILYDTGHHVIMDKIDPEDIYSVFSCSIDKEAIGRIFYKQNLTEKYTITVSVRQIF